MKDGSGDTGNFSFVSDSSGVIFHSSIAEKARSNTDPLAAEMEKSEAAAKGGAIAAGVDSNSGLKKSASASPAAASVSFVPRFSEPLRPTPHVLDLDSELARGGEAGAPGRNRNRNRNGDSSGAVPAIPASRRRAYSVKNSKNERRTMTLDPGDALHQEVFATGLAEKRVGLLSEWAQSNAKQHGDSEKEQAGFVDLA